MLESHIHLFNTPGGFYVFDVNTNAILKIRESVYDRLNGNKAKMNIDENNEAEEIIGKMKDRGFLSEKRLKVIAHPVDDVLEFYLDNRINMLTLQITQQCNLRCEYCVYSGGYNNRGHTNKKMSFDIAKKSIDFFISHSRNTEKINISFYGGEPLLEFEFIKKCIEYTNQKSEGKEVIFGMTTNGTLLNEEIVEFLQMHDISLTISLDGPKHIHNKNRRFAGNNEGSFEKVIENLELLRSKYPEYFKKVGFSIVLDPENGFSCINEFFTSFDAIKDNVKLTSVIADNYSKKNINVTENYNVEREYEVFKLFLSKLKVIDFKYITDIIQQEYIHLKRYFHELRKTVKELPDKNHHSGPCVPGVQRLFVSVDGDFFPCERVSESSETMRIGNIESGFEVEKCRKLLNIGELTKEKCKNCWAFRFCTLCAASADTLKELSGAKKGSACEGVRLYTESCLKDYCTLKEYGADFEVDAENEIISFIN